MEDESRNALKPGTEFEGYRFERVLGAGGFGVTYLATELLLDRKVAIKEFLPAGIATREPDGLSVAPLSRMDAEDFAWGRERFRTEAQTLVAFRHPNIVGVHRYFETNETGYLVMEFVDGQTLNAMVPPGATLDEDEIHEVFDPLLDGLQAVHDKLFLHRDIKPANIFIRRDGTPVLIDFGAARQALGQHSRSLTAIISEGYAPYEQYESEGEQGPWTDIYAVGGVLYRCVAGRRPTDAPARVSAIMRGRPDPLVPAAEAAGGNYSPALLHAIDTALSVRETERPQSVHELRELMTPTRLVARPSGAKAADPPRASPAPVKPAPAKPAPASPANAARTVPAQPKSPAPPREEPPAAPPPGNAPGKDHKTTGQQTAQLMLILLFSTLGALAVLAVVFLSLE